MLSGMPSTMKDDPRGDFPTIVTAADLRARATGENNARVRGAITRIISACQLAAERADLSASIDTDAAWFPYAIRNAVKQALEARGFRVSFYDGDQRDPGSGITVSW